ncbi:MAG: protein-glutamate O-methyltransferase CheR [Rhizonema sp. PD38]|nr:protein-glutamate O-methyltransferase CheR [Rhizonema sp. PD38]
MSNTESLSAKLKQAFIELITNHTGLEIRERDQADLSEKILARMKALNLDIAENYYQLLAFSPIYGHLEWQNLMTKLTNTDSYFFRDRGQLNVLRNQIFPEIIQRKQNNKRMRICSAGCSTGEEPYSLAIILKEIIPALEQWDLMILGVDINQAAIQKAKVGIYTPWSFRNNDPKTKQQYFKLIGSQYEIDQEISKMVKFEYLNLVKDSFPQPCSDLKELDLIVCRNVFIYLKESAITKVLNKFYQALQPLGYLLTGHAELFSQNLSLFHPKVFPETLVYQRQTNI